ncbi:MAG: hypothetical protein R2787_09995 [Saprospiraceae bacterium]
MPKQAGEHPIIGTFGDLNFYQRNGQYLVRQKPGPSRKRFKSHPHFAIPRAQSELFGRISSFCGQVRRRLRWRNARMFDGQINSRMLRLFSAVSKLDPQGKPGDKVWQRDLHLPQAIGLLSGFAFHDEFPLESILHADIEVDAQQDRRVTITGKPRRRMVTMPEGVTHLSIELLRLSTPPGQPVEVDGSTTFPATLASALPKKIELSLLPPERPGPWLYILRLIPCHEVDGQITWPKGTILPMEIVGVENAPVS